MTCQILLTGVVDIFCWSISEANDSPAFGRGTDLLRRVDVVLIEKLSQVLYTTAYFPEWSTTWLNLVILAFGPSNLGSHKMQAKRHFHHEYDLLRERNCSTTSCEFERRPGT